MNTNSAANAEATAWPRERSNDGSSFIPTPILPVPPKDVKLLEIFQERHIPYDDIVATVRTIYPGFDKSLLSKCRNYRQYGIAMRNQAVKLLEDHFRVLATESPRKPVRKKPKRIQCRLTEKAYGLLQQRIAHTGQTTQGYLEGLILRDLTEVHSAEL